MARKEINIGSSPNKGDGDPLRIAFDKVNDNFVELYAQNFGDPEAQPTNIIPSDDGVYDLGSLSNQWADVYIKDFLYLGGVRIETTAQGNLALAGAVVEIQDTVGSVFGDDSTVLVDGVNSSINLDGTVKGNIIPDTDVAYDIGSATNRFRDLYLSGSTINLGGLEITNDGGVITFGGEKVVVEGGTGDVQGSVFGDDSTLLVDAVNSVIPKAVIEDSTNWDTAYAWGDHSAAGYQSATAPFTGDVKGSVFADDSTLLVDSVAGKIVGDIENTSINTSNILSTGDIVIQNGSDIITLGSAGGATFQLPNKGVAFLGGGSVGNGYNVAFTDNGFVSLTSGNRMSILSGDDLILGTANGTTINNTVTVDSTVTAPSFVGDLTGSVFADDSTLLVDSVAGKIVGDVDASRVDATIVGGINVIATGSVYSSYFLADNLSGASLNIAAAENLSGPGGSVFIRPGVGTTVDGKIILDGTVETNTISPSSGNLSLTADNYVIIDSNNNGQIEIGRNSGVGNVIIGNNANGTDIEFQGTVNFNSNTITGVDWAPIVGGAIQANGLPSGTEVTDGIYAKDGQGLSIGYKDYSGLNTSIFVDETTGVQFWKDVTFDNVTVDFTTSAILNTPFAETANLATVATSGDYDDLTNKPTDLVRTTMAGSLDANSFDIYNLFAITLQTQTSAVSAVEGTVVIADGVGWDPLGNGRKSMVVYLGGAWREIAAVPGV